MSRRPFPVMWQGWYEGEKRPHQHIHAEITILTNASSGGELLISIYDDYLAYIGAPVSLVARLYRGYDFENSAACAQAEQRTCCYLWNFAGG
jgi:hypothetical protein